MCTVPHSEPGRVARGACPGWGGALETTSQPGPKKSDKGALLRTFLIADIRGYTTFTRTHGDETAARLAKKFADLARDSVEARGGEVIELRGDEALAVFTSTSQAIRAAIELQAVCE